MKRQRLIGIAWILLGIAVFCVWFGIAVSRLYGRWLGFRDHGYWDTFLAYFWQVGKTDLALSFLLGSIPVLTGIYFLRKKY